MQHCPKARCTLGAHERCLRCRKLLFRPSQCKGCASCGPSNFFRPMVFAAAPSADSELQSSRLAQARRCSVPARVVMTSFRLASRQHLLQSCFASLWAESNQTWLVEGHGQHQSKRSCFGAHTAHTAYEVCQLLSAAGKTQDVTEAELPIAGAESHQSIAICFETLVGSRSIRGAAKCSSPCGPASLVLAGHGYRYQHRNPSQT